jgi:hypothetical protein
LTLSIEPIGLSQEIECPKDMTSTSPILFHSVSINQLKTRHLYECSLTTLCLCLLLRVLFAYLIVAKDIVMSKKRRENRNSAGLNNRLKSEPESYTIVESAEESSSNHQANRKPNLLAKMKANWLVVLIICLLSLGALGAGLKYLEDDARREMAKREAQKGKLLSDKEKSETSLLNRINPFLPAPLPNPTPQLSKEYLYAGGKLLAVEDAGATQAPPADIAVWRPSSGEWWVMGQAGSQQTTQQYGVSGDIPVPGDFDGDGKTDFSIFRPSTSNWYFIYSAGGSGQYPFGTTGDIPVPADYDGDGKTDAAIYRPSTGGWYIARSSDGGFTILGYGAAGDTPVPADYDGDGRADLAVWRSSAATFYFYRSSNNLEQGITFGQPGDKPVPGDYDGDGRADAAVWRGGVYQWHILYSSTGQTEGFTFGDPQTDVYVQNDYDGDGKVDRAFWRPSTGVWHIVQSSKRGQPDEVRTVQWGINGDVPVPAYYRR